MTDEATINKKRKRFMTAFYIVMAVLLLLIIGLWNQAADFKTAYLQAVLFLEVMNWYDGFIIDEGWVRFSKFWVIPGRYGLCAVLGADVPEKAGFNGDLVRWSCDHCSFVVGIRSVAC